MVKTLLCLLVLPVLSAAQAALWERSIGAGFAAPVIAEGKLLLFHRVGGEEVLEALNPANGQTLWKIGYPTTYKDDFGFDEGPRSAPAVHGGRLFTHGAEGTLQAVDLSSGKRLWLVKTMEVYGVEKNWFGAGGTPLPSGELVLLNVGGKNGAGIVAFRADSGKEAWRATNDGASYSSGALSGPNAYFLTRNGFVSLEAATGKVQHTLRWRARSNASANAATPLIVGDEVFISASYGTGATVLKASQGWKQLWASDDALSNHYATSVVKDGFLYGFHGRQETGQEFRCVEWKTGKVRWSKEGFGAGTVTLAQDGRLFILREDGNLVLASANPDRLQITSTVKVLPGPVRAWPAWHAGILYARNETKLIAMRVGP